jgi:hypothetical protein
MVEGEAGVWEGIRVLGGGTAGGVLGDKAPLVSQAMRRPDGGIILPSRPS